MGLDPGGTGDGGKAGPGVGGCGGRDMSPTLLHTNTSYPSDPTHRQRPRGGGYIENLCIILIWAVIFLKSNCGLLGVLLGKWAGPWGYINSAKSSLYLEFLAHVQGLELQR